MLRAQRCQGAHGAERLHARQVGEERLSLNMLGTYICVSPCIKAANNLTQMASRPMRYPDFLPSGAGTKSKGTKTRADGPTPVTQRKVPTDHQSPKSEAKKQQKQEYHPPDPYYNEYESGTDSEPTIVNVEEFRADEQSQSQMNSQDKARKGNHHRQGSSTPRNQNQPPRDPHESFYTNGPDEATHHTGNMHVKEKQPFPIMCIYEHILILRRHGASVKYSPKSRAECPREESLLPGPPVQRGRNAVSSANIANPSRDAMFDINNALAWVVNTGGEVEFEALPPDESAAQLPCKGCGQEFDLEQELGEHLGVGNLKCAYPGCALRHLYCQTLLEQHVAAVHPNWDGDTFSQTNRSEYGSTQGPTSPWRGR